MKPLSGRAAPTPCISGIDAVLDDLPIPLIIVDGGLRVQQVNAATFALGLASPGAPRDQRVGDLLLCARASETPWGCGSGRWCSVCPLRQMATEAAATGRALAHREILMTHAPPASRSATDLLAVAVRLDVAPLRVLLALQPFESES